MSGLEITVKEALENAKEAGYEEGYEEGKKAVFKDIAWFMQTYKNDSGLRNRLTMYLSENDYN